MKKIVDFIFEASSLKRQPRLGYNLLGESESIADHIFGSIMIGYVLAKIGRADVKKVILMCLFHDLEESRTGEITKINNFYLKRDSHKAQKDVFTKLPSTEDEMSVLREYEEKKTLEAKLARDANILDLLFELKRLTEQGNLHAKDWLGANGLRLRTKQGKDLFKQLIVSDSHHWWKDLREEVLKTYIKE